MAVVKYDGVDVHIDSKIILEDVSFTLEAGEFAYIIGKVGSGKSTLLKTIYGEVPVVDGDAYVFDDFNLRNISNSRLQALRKELGIVFQDFQLLTDRNVHDNLDFVLKCTGWKDKHARNDRIAEVLELVGLLEKGYKRPHELSGGEQQRIVIARAILNKPSLILADEPTGNLDVETGRSIVELLQKICQSGSAIIMITHNLNMLSEYPGTVYKFENHGIKNISTQISDF